MVKASVIIPVYNDLERLEVCLDALSAQTFDDFEVIVVDNGSDVDIKGIVERHGFTYLKESKTSSYCARNRGVKHAKGEILAFTDSDCIPDKDWIKNGVRQITKHEKIGLVGGRVELFFKGEKPNAAELFDRYNSFDQEKVIKKSNFGMTANIFSTKKVFSKTGSFNPKLKSGGDLEWGQRVFSDGFKLFYANDVLVRHPARSSIKELIDKRRRLVGGWYDLHYHKDLKKFLRGLERNFFAYSNTVIKNLTFPDKLKYVYVSFILNLAATIELLMLGFGNKTKR